MNTADILQQLDVLGVQVRPTGRGTLWLDRPDQVPADLLATIREHKADILAVLTSTGAYQQPPPPRPAPPTLGIESTSGLRDAIPPAYRGGLEHWRWTGDSWTTTTNGEG